MPEVKGLRLMELLEKLRVADGGKLKRAALILFGKDPGRFYTNLTVKMGRFGKTDDDLKFQETEEGNLIQLLQEVLKQLGHKFLIKNISFEGLLRIEKGEYPEAALREMLLNALVHRNYYPFTPSGVESNVIASPLNALVTSIIGSKYLLNGVCSSFECSTPLAVPVVKKARCTIKSLGISIFFDPPSKGIKGGADSISKEQVTRRTIKGLSPDRKQILKETVSSFRSWLKENTKL